MRTSSVNYASTRKVLTKWKIDLRVCTFACITFFALQLDRGNIIQALSDNMLGDLGMTTNDYNTGQTIFYICFLFAEMPSQLISKWVGPDRWIPIQMVSWSLVAAFQAFLKNKGGYFACRALLGLIEGGLYVTLIIALVLLANLLQQHPRHNSLPFILVQIQRTPHPLELFLGLLPRNIHRWGLPSFRLSPHSRRRRQRRLAISVRLRRPNNRSNRDNCRALDARIPNAN